MRVPCEKKEKKGKKKRHREKIGDGETEGVS